MGQIQTLRCNNNNKTELTFKILKIENGHIFKILQYLFDIFSIYLYDFTYKYLKIHSIISTMSIFLGQENLWRLFRGVKVWTVRWTSRTSATSPNNWFRCRGSNRLQFQSCKYLNLCSGELLYWNKKFCGTYYDNIMICFNRFFLREQQLHAQNI